MYSRPDTNQRISLLLFRGVYLLVLALLAMLLFSAVARGQDVYPDLRTVQVLGSNPDVLRQPVTAGFESFGLRPGAMSIHTSGTAGWPMVAIDTAADCAGCGQPVQAGTIWLFLRISGQWYATGAERLRPSQLNGDKPAATSVGLDRMVGEEWLYDISRWGPMAGYDPKPGELVAAMVVAGSTRSDDQRPVLGRTQVVAFRWPGAAGSSDLPFEWQEGLSATVEPPTAPPSPVNPAPTAPVQPDVLPATDLSPYLHAMQALELQLLEVKAMLNAHIVTEEGHWRVVAAKWKQVAAVLTPIVTVITLWLTQGAK
jgi:hypothetical protein